MIYAIRGAFHHKPLYRSMFHKISMFQSQSQPPISLLGDEQEYANTIQQKIASLESNQPFFDRLIFFDPDLMATLPNFLNRFDPVVEFGKDCLVWVNQFVGVPWWGVLGAACIVARTSLLPLIYLQMKRTSKLAAVVPAILQMKKLVDKSQVSKSRRIYYTSRITFDIVRKQQLKFMRLFLYNIFHFPLLVTIIWSIRRLLVEDSVKSTSVLWIQSLSAVDPYYILPILTVGCYYYNLQRFISPENKHTLPSRLRSFGQFLLILWLPFLCNWPSAIVLYMFYNALFSLVQTTLTIHPLFQKFVDPKMMLYQLVVRLSEYDTKQSQALVESIKSGEETLLDKAIDEEKLVSQMKQALNQLESDELSKKASKYEDIYTKF